MACSGGMGRTVDSSKLGNLLVVDIPRYSREAKRKVGGDIRIPVINMRDGHTNKLWLSERVSAILMSRLLIYFFQFVSSSCFLKFPLFLRSVRNS